MSDRIFVPKLLPRPIYQIQIRKYTKVSFLHLFYLLLASFSSKILKNCLPFLSCTIFNGRLKWCLFIATLQSLG